jgi:hypothetical protein
MFTPSAIVRETTEQIMRRLDSLPINDRTYLLRACAEDCVAEVEQWSVAPPTSRDLQAFAKRLFFLHVEITQLERKAGRDEKKGERGVN